MYGLIWLVLCAYFSSYPSIMKFWHRDCVRSLSYPEDTTGLSVYKLDWTSESWLILKKFVKKHLAWKPCSFSWHLNSHLIINSAEDLDFSILNLPLGLLVLPCLVLFTDLLSRLHANLMLDPRFPSQLCFWLDSISVKLFSTAYLLLMQRHSFF